MFKKHMTPLTKGGTLHSGKNPTTSPLSAAAGGMQNFQSYGKATPMAQPADQPAPPNSGLGSGSFTGNGIA